MADEKTRIFRDPRIDRSISWALSLVVTVMLAIAAATYSDLREQMGSLSVSVNNLSLAVALSEQRESVVQDLKQEILISKEERKELQEDITSLELWRASQTGR
jgi:hypothetical protein